MKTALGLILSESSKFLYLWPQRDDSMPPPAADPDEVGPLQQPPFCSCHSNHLQPETQPLYLMAAQPASLQSAARSEYAASFSIYELSDFLTLRAATDHRTESGLSVLSDLRWKNFLLASILICRAILVGSSDVHCWYSGMTALPNLNELLLFAMTSSGTPPSSIVVSQLEEGKVLQVPLTIKLRRTSSNLRYGDSRCTTYTL